MKDEDKEKRRLLIYLYLKLGSNNRIYMEINASTEYQLDVMDLVKQGVPLEIAKAQAKHRPTPIMEELQADKNAVDYYIERNGICESDYITALDKDYPKWARDHKPPLYIIKRGESKKDYPEDTTPIPEEVKKAVESDGGSNKA